MPALELEFEVYCSCGEGLCQQTTEGQTRGRGMPFITVEPCEHCISEAHDKIYDKGYDQALLDKKDVTI